MTKALRPCKVLLLSGGAPGDVAVPRAQCPQKQGGCGGQDTAGCMARSPAVNQANEVSALTLQNRTLM